MKSSSLLFLLLFFQVQMQAQWEPFKVGSSSHYECLEEFYVSTPSMNIQVFEKGGLIQFESVSSDTMGDTLMYHAPEVFMSDLDLPFQTVHCPEEASWSGSILNINGSWQSSTYLNTKIHWPSNPTDSGLFMQISTDSALVFSPAALDTTTVFDQVDSLAEFNVDLYVNGALILEDSVYDMSLKLSKHFGMTAFPLPVALPRLVVPVELRTMDTLGYNFGLTDYGVYHYEVGTELHYIARSESGYHNGSWNEISSVTTTLDRFEVKQVYLNSDGVVAYEMELRQSIRRDSFEQNQNNQVSELLGSDYSHASGTVLWKDLDLQQFFHFSAPNESYVISNRRHYIARDQGDHAELIFRSIPHAPVDSCPTQQNTGEGYGVNEFVQLDTRYGLFRESSSGIYDYTSPYFIYEKELMYFKNGNTVFGEPVPPLSVEETPEMTALNVFPNPSTNFLTLSAPSALEHVAVVDLSGRVIQVPQSITNAGMQLDIQHLDAGMYMVTGEMNGELYTVRFVKR